MERNFAKNIVDKGHDVFMNLDVKLRQSANEIVVCQVLQELIKVGIKDVVICPGGRNAPFVAAMEHIPHFKQFFWSEERSAAFFALGRSRATKCPTAIIVTSGTAAGELLPAAMEAYYTEVPILLITADRPRRFRGSGAPQAAEQVGLFGQYAVFEQDLANDELCTLKEWNLNGAAHLNVCLEEPKANSFESEPLLDFQEIYPALRKAMRSGSQNFLDAFIKKSHFPLVVVSAITEEAQESIIRFLVEYNAPVFLEATSGIRERPELAHLRIHRTEKIWKAAEKAGYSIDGILRIGSVPTCRLWRDLEDKRDHMEVCIMSDNAFSGLSGTSIEAIPLKDFFEQYYLSKTVNENASAWISSDHQYLRDLFAILEEEPESEASLIYQLSKQVSLHSLVYLGNSLPIREWDAYGDGSYKGVRVFANRGLNGIDGQISTFLGMCHQDKQNWGIFGDLTTLYDLAGPWILKQMENIDLNLVVINNGGGKIFSRMFPQKQIQNNHHVQFKPLADLWDIQYEKYHRLPRIIPYGGHRLIEIVPNEASTVRFINKVGSL